MNLKERAIKAAQTEDESLEVPLYRIAGKYLLAHDTVEEALDKARQDQLNLKAESRQLLEVSRILFKVQKEEFENQ